MHISAIAFLIALTSIAAGPSAATSSDWYIIGNFTGRCESDEGPAHLISLHQQVGRPYKTRDVTEGGKVVETTLILSGGEIPYYRGLARCEAALRRGKAQQQQELDKYK